MTGVFVAVKKLVSAAATIATLAFTLVVAVPASSTASVAPVLSTPISLPAGSGPNSVAFSPDGTKANVANKQASTVSVIMVATDTLGTPITLPARSGPASVAFSPDGSKAYVANYDASTVSMITVATDTLGTSITLPVDSGPCAVAISPDGKKVYVANESTSTVSVIVNSGMASAPRTLRAGATTARSVALSWSAPASLNGGVITDYVIQYRRTQASSWSTFSHTASTARARTVTGLTAGTSYQFQVAAQTAAGTSAFSTPVTKTTLAR